MHSYNTLILHLLKMSIKNNKKFFIEKKIKKILTSKKICVKIKLKTKFLVRVEV